MVGIAAPRLDRGSGGGDGQPGCFPFGEPVLQPPSREARLPQDGDGLVGEGAVGAAAVGDDLPVTGQLGQPPAQLADRDRDRFGEVPGGVLGGGAHVQDDQAVAVPQPAGQLPAGGRVQRPTVSQGGGGQPLDLGPAAGGQGPQG